MGAVKRALYIEIRQRIQHETIKSILTDTIYLIADLPYLYNMKTHHTTNQSGDNKQGGFHVC